MNEIVEKRTKTSKTFDLGGGRYRLETGRHSHTLKNGLWLPTNTGIVEEAGTDADVGLNYIAKSRSEAMDYDIKFGKNDPVWMKVKHIPSGKKVTFKPKNNNNKPDHAIVGNKITVSQAWDGIDMEILVTDKGTKTNYIITSAVGQRVVEFTVNGDVADFAVGRPFYLTAEGLAVYVPTAFSSGVLSYDFRVVPIGTKIDPSVTVRPEATFDNWFEFNGLKGSLTWAQTVATTTGDLGSTANGGIGVEYLSIGNGDDGSYWYLRRAAVYFDTSAITADNTVTSASLRTVQYGAASGGNELQVFLGTFDIPLVGDDINNFSDAVSSKWEPTLTDDTAISTSAVDVTGTTKLMLRNKADIDASFSSALTYLIHSSSTATADYRPALTVGYEAAGSPVVPSFGRSGNAYPFGRRNWR